MFLSNDSQYDPTGIIATPQRQPSQAVSVTTLAGQVVRRNVSRNEALRGLTPGIYIVDGHKVLVR